MVVAPIDDIIACFVIADVVRRLATITFFAFHGSRGYLII